MSTPADRGLRILRRRAHVLLASVFRSDMESAYLWLSLYTKEGHIGHMERPAARTLIALLKRVRVRGRPVLPRGGTTRMSRGVEMGRARLL